MDLEISDNGEVCLMSQLCEIVFKIDPKTGEPASIHVQADNERL